MDLDHDPPGSDGEDTYVLSSTRRSSRTVARAAAISKQRWRELKQMDKGGFWEQGSSSDSESDVGSNGDGEDQSDDVGGDLDDEHAWEFESAARGEEGIPLWDLLGEGFAREAAAIGVLKLLLISKL